MFWLNWPDEINIICEYSRRKQNLNTGTRSVQQTFVRTKFKRKHHSGYSNLFKIACWWDHLFWFSNIRKEVPLTSWLLNIRVWNRVDSKSDQSAPKHGISSHILDLFVRNHRWSAFERCVRWLYRWTGEIGKLRRQQSSRLYRKQCNCVADGELWTCC